MIAHTYFEVVLKMHHDVTLDAETQEISRNIANSSFCVAERRCAIHAVHGATNLQAAPLAKNNHITTNIL